MKKLLMEHTKMNPFMNEVAPSSPVLSQIFDVLTTLTGSFYNEMFFRKAPHTKPSCILGKFQKSSRLVMSSDATRIVPFLC